MKIEVVDKDAIPKTKQKYKWDDLIEALVALPPGRALKLPPMPTAGPEYRSAWQTVMQRLPRLRPGVRPCFRTTNDATYVTLVDL